MRGQREIIASLDGVSRRFGRVEALRAVSLTVRRGDVYGLLGLNGAGKTTALRLWLGLIGPHAGTVRLFDEVLPAGRLAAIGRVGAMIETPAFYPHLSGRTNLRLLARLAGLEAASRAVDEALDLCGLGEVAGKRVREYSLGMAQRLHLAQALLGRPDLLILDEPTGNLDPQGILDVRRLIGRFNREREVTIVLSSHQLSEVEGVCNRVAILDRGQHRVETDVKDLFDREIGRVMIETEDGDLTDRTLAELPWCVRLNREGGRFLVEIPRTRRAELNRWLHDRGVAVSEFAERRPTLEDYFHRTIAGNVP